jgi:hypothetical protein
MAMIHAMTERTVAAPADRVYAILADYREHHPRILPPAFSDLVIEQGGTGAGTVIRFRLTLGGRTQTFRQRVDEPQPGRTLTETDLDTGAVTSFTVTPAGDSSRVRIKTSYERGGLRGLLESVVAPTMLRRLYADELTRLDRYAREQAMTTTAR